MLEGRGQRYSFPAYDFEHPGFVADMAPLTVAAWQRPALDVLPFASVDIDRLGRRERYRAGLDLFWRPTGRQQLSLALRPDFGQVESDDLVVDFGAIETCFNEKRPFFTENQSLFSLATSSGGQLINTRRIGAAPDAGPKGVTDIALALKYSLSGERTEWGLLLAQEDDSSHALGREYLALRGRWRGGSLGLGWLSTHTDRPTLDRQASVHALDGQWLPAPGISLRGQLIASDILQRANVTNRGLDLDQHGSGVWLRADWAPGPRLLQRLELSRYDRDFQINDLGYMRRNDLRELLSTTTLYTRSYAAGSRLQSSQWQLELVGRQKTHPGQRPAVAFAASAQHGQPRCLRVGARGLCR